MKVALNLDDFSVVNNRLDLLLKLKEHFPNFKVSLFTVPIDRECDWGPYQIREESLNRIKDCLGWMQIIPHGLTHESSREMEKVNYSMFRENIMPLIIDAFKLDGLPFVGGFKAPHWRWSEDVVKVLDREGWFGAVDRDKAMPCPKKFYKYTHLLNEPFWESDLEVLKLHGHIFGTKNDLGLCMDNLLSLPKDIEWHFITDFIEEL